MTLAETRQSRQVATFTLAVLPLSRSATPLPLVNQPPVVIIQLAPRPLSGAICRAKLSEKSRPDGGVAMSPGAVPRSAGFGVARSAGGGGDAFHPIVYSVA